MKKAIRKFFAGLYRLMGGQTTDMPNGTVRSFGKGHVMFEAKR